VSKHVHNPNATLQLHVYSTDSKAGFAVLHKIGLKLQSYPKTEVAGRKEREENVIDERGFETLLGNRGVQYTVHYERKKWNSAVPAENLETKRSEGDPERGRCLHCAEEREFHLLLKCPETQEVEGAHEQQMAAYQ
jgi:hypothetical protein